MSDTATALGRCDAPLLVVMSHQPSEKMANWFWRLLLEVGIQKTEVRIIYTLDEPPAGKGGKPLVGQLRSAFERFSAEVQASTPRVVVPLGSEALYALTGIQENIFKSRGYVIPKQFFHTVEREVWQQFATYKRPNKDKGINAGDPRFKWITTAAEPLLGLDFQGTVIPAFTLDYVRLQAFAVRTAFKSDFMRARRAMDGKLDMVDDRFAYADKLEAYFDGPCVVKLKWFAPDSLGDLVAVDIETHGIDNEVIDRVSLSDGEHTASFEWTDLVRDYMDRLFAHPTRMFAVHNSPFDIPRLRRNGVVIPQEVIDERLVDTMWAAVVLQPDLHKGLVAVAPVYLDVYPWKWRSIADADPIRYSAKDAYVTVLLARRIIDLLKQMGMWNLFMGRGSHPGPGVQKTIPEISAMTDGGLALDRDKAAWWLGVLERKLSRLLRLWTREFGALNPFSNPAMCNLFYGQWKLPVHKDKEDKVATVDELACVKLQAYITSDYAATYDDGPWREDTRCSPRLFDLLLALRNCSKTMSTYVLPVSLNEQARVHPQYMPVAKDDENEKKFNSKSKGNTATGRLASFKPNIQNQPKAIRVLYVPDTPNMCFLQRDYKSAELYVMAYMAGDRRLQDDLKHDMHSRNSERFRTTRPTAKNVTYAGQYLAGAPKVSDMILEQEHVFIHPDECRRILDGLAEYYYETTAYKQLLVSQAKTQKHVRNPFGRVRFFYDGSATAAVNFIPQSTVADILWCVLYDVAQMAKSLGGRLTTTVHDSILIQVPMDAVDVAGQRMGEIMERRFDNVAPGFYIPTELEVGAPGASWGDLRKVA